MVASRMGSPRGERPPGRAAAEANGGILRLAKGVLIVIWGAVPWCVLIRTAVWRPGLVVRVAIHSSSEPGCVQVLLAQQQHKTYETQERLTLVEDENYARQALEAEHQQLVAHLNLHQKHVEAAQLQQMEVCNDPQPEG